MLCSGPGRPASITPSFSTPSYPPCCHEQAISPPPDQPRPFLHRPHLHYRLIISLPTTLRSPSSAHNILSSISSLLQKDDPILCHVRKDPSRRFRPTTSRILSIDTTKSKVGQKIPSAGVKIVRPAPTGVHVPFILLTSFDQTSCKYIKGAQPPIVFAIFDVKFLPLVLLSPPGPQKSMTFPSSFFNSRLLLLPFWLLP